MFMIPKLLIIDDNIEILELLQEILEQDYHIIQSTNALQALNILANTSINLIISDVMMPDMDGFEFCKIIKSDFEYAHIPVILLTAKNTLKSRIEGLELGGDAYIDKPFSPRHLKAQIANLIVNRNKIREYCTKSPFVHITNNEYNKTEDSFMENLNDIIINNIDNQQLGGEFLANKLNMSRPTLYRKIKIISNQSINDLINLTRLKKAAELLSEGKYKVFEVSNIVGFSSPNHFNRLFYKQFKMSPTSFMKNTGDAKECNGKNQ